jgi:hypothetical protein
MIIAFVIAILFAFMFLCEVYQQDKLIKSLKEELAEKDKSVTYYQHVIEGFREKVKEEEEKYEIIQAPYCTSDSDLIKYNSQKAMENAIRNKLAMLLGNEIAKRFEPRVLPLGEGKEKYSLTIKAKKI